MAEDRHKLRRFTADPGRSLTELAGIADGANTTEGKRIHSTWQDAAETLEGLAFGKLDQQDPTTRQRLDRRHYLAVPLLLAMAVMGMGIGGYFLFFKTYEAAEKAGERRNQELLAPLSSSTAVPMSTQP